MQQDIRIAPSILSSDFGNLERDIRAVTETDRDSNESGADFLFEQPHKDLGLHQIYHKLRCLQ